MALFVTMLVLVLLFTAGLRLWRRASSVLGDPASASGAFGDVQHGV